MTMLKNEYEMLDLNALKREIMSKVQPDIDNIHEQYGLLAVTPIESFAVDIHYPAQQYPTKVSSINLEKKGLCGPTLRHQRSILVIRQ